MKSRLSPDFTNTLATMKNNIFATLNCIQIGKIESYSTSTQTAEIALQVKARANGKAILDYPLLVDCPVSTAQCTWP